MCDNLKTFLTNQIFSSFKKLKKKKKKTRKMSCYLETVMCKPVNLVWISAFLIKIYWLNEPRNTGVGRNKIDKLKEKNPRKSVLIKCCFWALLFDYCVICTESDLWTKSNLGFKITTILDWFSFLYCPKIDSNCHYLSL